MAARALLMTRMAHEVRRERCAPSPGRTCQCQVPALYTEIGFQAVPVPVRRRAGVPGQPVKPRRLRFVEPTLTIASGLN